MAKFNKGYIPWNKGLVKTTDSRVKGPISSSRMTGKNHSQETKDKIKATNKGQIQKPTSLITREKLSKQSLERWQDPEYAEMMMSRSLESNQLIRPNNPEKKVLGILKSLESDIKYVGDGSYWVLGTGKNPDFVNEARKQIVEVFGCYWHGCSKHFPDKVKQRRNVLRINKFKKFGYSVLVIWECELKDKEKVVSRVKQLEAMEVT